MISKNSSVYKKRDRRGQNILLSLIFLFVFGGVLWFFIFQNIKINQKRSELQTKLSDLQTQVRELSARREELQAGIVETQTKEYQEKVLREQGLYQKPGEEVITVLPPEKQQVQTAPPKEKRKKVWWDPFSLFTRE